MKRVAASAILMLAVACARGTYDDRPYRPEATVASPTSEGAPDGSMLYARDCGFCHGDGAEGTRHGPPLRGERAPTLTDFVLRTGRMPLSSPDEPMRRRPSRYSEDEIDAIVEHLATVTDEEIAIPDPDPDRGDIGHGAELYLENCAACHSTTGVGGAIAQGRLPGRVGGTTDVAAPGLYDASSLEIAEATRTGPGTMPPFGEQLLSDADVDSIVRYVLYLQDPADPGGAAIGRIGPVAEGAVGLLIGIVLLLVLSRWIGSTAVRR